MPETRYLREYTDGKLSAEIPYEVSDEQLADEAEAAAAALIAGELDKATNWGQAKTPLIKLVKRLMSKGLIP